MPYLQPRNLGPVPTLIKENLLPSNQRLLQRRSNAHRLYRRRQLQRKGGIVEDSSSELVRLGDKRILEAVPVRLRDLAAHTGVVVQVDVVHRRLRVHGQLAARADDLGRVFLSGSHHPRCVEVCDLAVVEFHEADGVVAVVVLAQVWFYCCDADGGDGFDLAVGAEEP